MTPDYGFDAYLEQLVLIVDGMSARRAASGFEDREAKLKAACEQAVRSLGSDLRAISDLEARLAEHFGAPFDERRRADDIGGDRPLDRAASEGARGSSACRGVTSEGTRPNPSLP